MTIKFKYNCDKCGHEYNEQRADYELTPFFTICHSCGEGTYLEVSQEIIETAQEVIIEE